MSIDTQAVSPGEGRIRAFLALRRPGESDARLGARLVILAPVPFYFVFATAITVLGIEFEACLGLALTYWLLIGLLQCLYLVPAIGAAVVAKRPQLAWGLLGGGVIIAVGNAAGWALGLHIGPL